MTFTEKKEQVRKRWKRKRWFRKYSQWVMFGVVAVLWLSCWFLVTYFIKATTENGWATRGQFGDMFGAVNALFSGLAFGGIIITIFLQRQELKLQRKELSLTRQELQETRKEFQSQNVTLNRQRFETTFFNMLSIHNVLAASTAHISIKECTGIKAFDEFKVDFRNELTSVHKIFDATKHERYRQIFGNYFGRIFPNVSPYFQSLLAIYRVVKQSQFPSEVELRYFEILRSYISISERVFLFYYLALRPKMLFSREFHSLGNDLKMLDIPDYYLIDKSHIRLLAYIPSTEESEYPMG